MDPTRLLGYKSPLFLVVFGVEPSLSPLLQNPVVVVLLDNVSLTIPKQVSLHNFLRPGAGEDHGQSHMPSPASVSSHGLRQHYQGGLHDSGIGAVAPN